MAPPLCTICYADEAAVQFECASPDCEYRLCGECLKHAFKDFSGANNKACQLCNRPSTIRMAEARIGKGGVKAVQRELRERVELEVRQERGILAAGTEKASQMNEEALQLFNAASDKLNMKCPKCEMVFHDYSGCNALTCANNDCKAKFCAICLMDCGADAHAHVRREHGDLFDRPMFELSREHRTARITASFLGRLEGSGKPFELIQLVRNHLERAGQMGPEGVGGGSSMRKAESFIEQATQDLERVIAADRLSVLVESQSSITRSGITSSDVSPRVAISSNIRIWLEQAKAEFELTVEAEIDGRWTIADSAEQVKEWIDKGLIVSSGPLATLKQAMKCAVVAIEGKRSLYQVKQKGSEPGSEKMKLLFTNVDRKGLAAKNHNDFDYDFQGRFRILALNPNDRYIRLLQYIKAQDTSSTLPQPLEHFIGKGEPKPVFFKLEAAVPETMASLNEDQRKAGHPLCLKSAGEVAGPPGTGKTRTISELVRALLRCTSTDIIVLSERNGAIDAIAEKFATLCTKTIGKTTKVTDLSMWADIVTFGSLDAMGKHAKLFLLAAKVKYHPEVVEAKRAEKECKDANSKYGRKMREKIADQIKEFADKFEDDLAWNRNTKILESTDDDLASADRTVRYVSKIELEAASLLQRALTETALDALVDASGPLLVHLFPIKYDKREAESRLRDISRRLTNLLKSDEFDQKRIEELDAHHTKSQQARQAVESRVEQELAAGSRLKMSTIGSSHRLFVPAKDNDDDNVTGSLARLKIGQQANDDAEGAVIIFDESGCIPSFELLGLSRLECPISAILTVGDKKQLPPYNPTPNNRDRTNPRHTVGHGLKSLLDVSQVRERTALRTQYRVPKDIATILDTRIYGGQYTTHPEVVQRGLEFFHVSKYQRKERRKYQNSAEVDVVLQLARQKVMEGSSVMILTPYKNQQREIQFQIKRQRLDVLEEAAVLTIDQCQGKEADVVLFTLVQKPTRFLNKNRLNVAMSRTKNKLIFVANRDEFRRASENSNWDCFLIAEDILREATVRDS